MRKDRPMATFPFMACLLALMGAAGSNPPLGVEGVGVEEKLGAAVPGDTVLKDEEDRTLTLGSLLGKPTILTLNYFRCAGICTPLLNGVVDALNAMPLEPGKDYQVITVSFDPRDTPEMAFRKKVNYLKQMARPFPPEAWRFLTGDGAATRRICDAVGFGFRAQGEEFIHAGVIVVLSPKGEVTRYMYGTSFIPADLQMALGEAARGEARPTVSKILQFCFSYDPASRRYVFAMTRAIGAFIIILAFGFGIAVAFRGRGKKKKDTVDTAP